jgi:hypothetical protein
VIEFDFVTRLLTILLSPALSRSGQALQERVFGKKKGLTDGGTPEQRFTAYEKLRRACVELRTTLDVLWSLPTGFVGGLVALSIIYRQLHRIPSLAAAANDGFLGVAVVGSQDAVEAASAIATGLQAAINQHHPTGSGQSRNKVVVTDWTVFDQALGRFVAFSRSDLGIQPLQPTAVDDRLPATE